VESDSPYTPNFPSPPLDPYVHDGSSSQRLTDIYRRDGDQQQIWVEQDPYYNDQTVMAPIELPKCAPAVAFTAGLPLHAPTPLPRASSLLFSDAENLNYPVLRRPQSSQPCPPLGYLHPASQAPNEPQQNFVGSAYCLDGPAQTTFPTPSELLAELAAKNGNNEEPRSEKKTETARKARQRAVAQSVGFVPTDPYVTALEFHSTVADCCSQRHYIVP
jgi:hypothetical protein